MYKKIILALWVISCISLFFYSFTQVDLGLTLTRASVFQIVQKSFQYVGYFNRPFSAYLFIFLVTFLFTIYLLLLSFLKKNKFEAKTLWIMVFITGTILSVSYNAFSYDFFNYIFDAKIVTHYLQNPYIKKALDFPNDPMLGFMHWTHRTYPYGPIWLGLTIPLSFIGLNFFLLTFYLFKFLFFASYIICCYFIYKISKITKFSNPYFAVTFFAFNPFVVIEGLVSAHIDIVMMAFLLAGIYFLFSNRKYSSILILLISAGVKFATILLLPLFLWFPFSKNKNKLEIFITCSLLIMIIGVILQSYRTNFQPWYFLLVIPIASLITSRYFVFIPTVIFSFLILFQYAPFLYTGNFDYPIPIILNQMLLISILLSLLPVVLRYLFMHVKK